MKKYLELGVPVSNCYQFMAYPLSILANHQESYEWIYCNLIQTCVDLDLFQSPVPYYYYIFDYTISPWLEVQKLNRNIIDATDINIIYFIEKSIELGYYVYLNVDEFYIPNRTRYLQDHFSHDILVHGFDSEKKELNLFGFTNNYLLETSLVSYDNFCKAYVSANELDQNLTQIIMYKYNQQGTYSLKPDAIADALTDYLHGANTSKRFNALREPWTRAYGIKGYEHISKYIDECIIRKVFPDIRIFHFLYEHKSLMKERINYLIKKGYVTNTEIVKEWDVIVDKALTLRNKLLKMALKGFAVENINTLKELIDYIEKHENIVLHKLLLNLK